jgi:hypothetical protein
MPDGIAAFFLGRSTKRNAGATNDEATRHGLRTMVTPGGVFITFL